MNKEIELKNVVNVVFTSFAQNYARVSINDTLKTIKFKVVKNETTGTYKLVVTKGIEHCVVSLDGY